MRWNSSLLIGDAHIDGQHQGLFRLLDTLTLSTDDKDNRSRAEAAITALRDYVAKHLRDEEALLRSVRYKDYAAHCASHREFEIDLDRIAARIAAEPPTVVLNEIEQFVSCWLVDHIATVDMRYKPFIIG